MEFSHSRSPTGPGSWNAHVTTGDVTFAYSCCAGPASQNEAHTCRITSYSSSDEEYDVILHVCASFCDAGPAQQLYANVTSPVVTWAFHEPGPVGDRLWLNSMCGANLIAHALVRDGKQVRLIYGDPGEAGVREAIEALLEGRYPAAPELPGVQGPAAGDDVA